MRTETSKKFLTNRFCNVMGWYDIPAARDPATAKVGEMYLDYNSTMGGYVVRKKVPEGNSMSSPFGSQRYAPKEFAAFLDGIYEMHFYLKAVN